MATVTATSSLYHMIVSLQRLFLLFIQQQQQEQQQQQQNIMLQPPPPSRTTTTTRTTAAATKYHAAATTANTSRTTTTTTTTNQQHLGDHTILGTLRLWLSVSMMSFSYFCSNTTSVSFVHSFLMSSFWWFILGGIT
jgi:hypothetical protein